MAFSQIEQLLQQVSEKLEILYKQKTYSYAVFFPFEGYSSIEYRSKEENFSLISPFVTANPGTSLSEPHIVGEVTQFLSTIHEGNVSDINIIVNKMPNNEYIAYITYSSTLDDSQPIRIYVDGVLYPVDTGTAETA